MSDTGELAILCLIVGRGILREGEVSGMPACLLRNLYAGQEATVKTGHGTMDWFKIGNGVGQGCILLPREEQGEIISPS